MSGGDPGPEAGHRRQELRVPAADGVPLAGTAFLPTAEPHGRSVIINSATAVPRRFYGRFAAFLADRGFRVLTYDYRGIGDSPNPDGRLGVRMHHWGEADIAGAIDWVIAEWPDDRPLLVGHSAGGQLVGLAANADRVSGLLAVAVQSGYWGHWSGPYRYALVLLWYVGMPLASRALGFFPSRLFGLGEDLPAGVALEWAAWCRDPEYLFGARRPAMADGFSRLTSPIRALAFTDDRYAPPASVRAFLSFYPNAPVEYRELAPADVGLSRIGHLGFFRERARDAFWTDAADWLGSIRR